MRTRIAVCCLLLTLSVAGTALATEAPKPTFASALDRDFTGVEREVVPAAEAMPEDKYEFVPTQGEFKDVRNFGAQIKHIASVNYIIGGVILGEKPPVDLGTGEDGPASVKSKAEIVKYLKDSFAYAHKAISSITAANVLTPIKAPWGPDMTTRLNMAVTAVSHPFDHYGQIVEYLRMNSIVPPASRK